MVDKVTGKSCEYRHLISGTVNGHSKEEWEKSFANEIGRLANGVGQRMPTGTNTTDWNGTLYCGLTLEWSYLARTVQLSMPGYIEATLNKFQHAIPAKPQHAPHAWAQPVYGRTGQAPLPDNDSPPLDVKAIN